MSESEVIFLMRENQHINFVMRMRSSGFDVKLALISSMPLALLDFYRKLFWDKDCEELIRTVEENKQRIDDWAEANIELPELLSN
jgi:hypothetical protein